MAKKTAMIFGWIFLLIGVLGFIPGVTTSDGMLLGIFKVGTMHNIIHIVTGILALLFAKSEEKAKGFLKIFGIIYAVIAIIGFFSTDSILGFVMKNTADDILHAIVAIVFLWAGFAGGKKMMAGGDKKPMGQMSQGGGQDQGGGQPQGGGDQGMNQGQ